MPLTAFQREALHSAIRLVIVDRMRLLGMSPAVAEGLWKLNIGGGLGTVGIPAIQLDHNIGNLVFAIELACRDDAKERSDEGGPSTSE